MSADDLPSLLKSWHREVWRRGGAALAKLGAVTAGLAILAYGLSSYFARPVADVSWVVFALWSMIGVVIGSYACTEPMNAKTLTARQREVLKSLAALDDVRTIDPLITELGSFYHPVGFLADAIVAALVRLLPRLGAEEAYLVTTQRLYRYITPEAAERIPDLVITILRLLRHVGDQEALARVAHLIVQDAPTKMQQRVRDEARLCFPDLLAAADFGGPGRLSRWVRSLPTQTTVSLKWDEFILPRLAIRQILPRLSVEEFLMLDPPVRQRLYRSLTGGTYEYPIINGELSRLGAGYALTLLDLAVRACDREAIATVRTLVFQDTRAPRVVREAARDCLPAFEELARQEKVGRTLLRASNAPAGVETDLLRPAAGAAPTDPHELLRTDMQNRTRAATQEQDEPLKVRTGARE